MLRPAPELSLRLTEDTTSSFAARRALRHLLGKDATTPFGEAALLGVTELVNNATMYNPGGCWVSVWHTADNALRVEVEDVGTELPALPPVPSPAQLAGRGLNIVDTIADRWGAMPSRRGKTVWFEIDCPSPS
jgi:anti-sigma regulatory factor (Ser/Thr protein kinase)